MKANNVPCFGSLSFRRPLFPAPSALHSPNHNIVLDKLISGQPALPFAKPYGDSHHHSPRSTAAVMEPAEWLVCQHCPFLGAWVPGPRGLLHFSSHGNTKSLAINSSCKRSGTETMSIWHGSFVSMTRAIDSDSKCRPFPTRLSTNVRSQDSLPFLKRNKKIIIKQRNKEHHHRFVPVRQFPNRVSTSFKHHMHIYFYGPRNKHK